MSSIRQVVEDPEFTKQLEALDDVRFLDERLAAVHWAATYGADGLPRVADSGILRVIRIPGRGGQTLRVFMEVWPSEVILRWIEPVPEPGIEVR